MASVHTIVTSVLQTETEYKGDETCDCSTGSGKNYKSCTKIYSCELLRGIVDYGDGETAENITFYDYEDRLGSKVS